MGGLWILVKEVEIGVIFGRESVDVIRLLILFKWPR